MMIRRHRFRKLTAIGLSALLMSAVLALPPSAPAQTAAAATPVTEIDNLLSMKYGLFVHYVPGLTVNKQGVVVNDINALANDFDAQGFANDLESFGVEYVKFTAWHKGMYPLYPSAVMTKWRGPGTSSSRDLIGEMIDAVRAKGIAVLLYTHPRDGHDMSNTDQIATGWGDNGAAFGSEPNPATFNFTKWNDFINESYRELLDRYASRITGIYLDEGDGQARSYNVVDYPRLRTLIRNANPKLVVQQNFYGNLYSADVADHEYYRWGEFANNDGSVWPAYKNQSVSSVAASLWWTTVPSTTNVMTFTPEDMYRYSVLQVAANRSGGGVNWAAGVYPGGGWEAGFATTMTTIKNLMEPVKKSIKGTYPSTSWPTTDGTTVGQLSWGVATRSPDDLTQYLHVLKPPTGTSLTIPAPADGRQFVRAELLADGTQLTLTQSSSGLTIQLPAGKSWSTLDTVIELQSATLSTNRTASSSSSVEINGWSASRAVDGIVSSEGSSMGYSSSLSESANHTESFTVDLGTSMNVNQVVVSPRTDGVNAGHGLPVSSRIDTSTDGSTWVTRWTQNNRPFSAKSIAVDFTTVSARYVRITATDLRANPNDGNRFRLQFAEFSARYANPVGSSVLLTNAYHWRQLQGTGNAVNGLTDARYVAGVPTTSANNLEIGFSIADAGNGSVTLTNDYSGLRLEVSGLGYNGRTDVKMVVQTNSPITNAQRWVVESTPDGLVRFVNVGSGLALHMTGDRYASSWDIRHVVAVPASWNSDEQRWRIN